MTNLNYDARHLTSLATSHDGLATQVAEGSAPSAGLIASMSATHGEVASPVTAAVASLEAIIQARGAAISGRYTTAAQKVRTSRDTYEGGDGEGSASIASVQI